MSVYKKLLIVWLAVFWLVCLIGLAAYWLSSLFALAGLLLPLMIKRYLDRLTCPHCNMPVTYQGEIVGVAYYGGFLNRVCRKCGGRLDVDSMALGK